jgi:hypothetical protein
MNRITTLALIAGSALGMSANAQTSLDTDRAYAAEMLADAGSRANLLQSGSAGHDGNFFIASGDGNYRLNVSGVTQFRYVMNFHDEDDGSANPSPDNEEFTNGFDLTRAYLDFTGNVINPETIYKIRGEFQGGSQGDDDGSFNLEDAWAQHNFENGMSVRWGQFKAPVLFEEFYVDSHYQLAADRSVTNEVFTGGYTQGVALSYRDDNWGGTFSVNDGARTANTPYFSAAEADYALTARLDFLLAGGDWATFNDFTSWRGNDVFDARIGGAIHWQTAGDTAAFGPGGQVAVTEADLLVYTLDVSLEGNGWNAFAAFVGNSLDPDQGASSDNYGGIIQAGVFVADQWELFARWDAIFFDDDFTTGDNDDDFHTITAGVNYYFVPESHAAKLTADVVYFLNEIDAATQVGALAPSQKTTLLPSGDDDQFAIRLQMQLMF